MKRICTIAVGLGLLGLATTAKAINVDFEGNPSGSEVQFAGFGNGIFTVAAVNNGAGANEARVLNSEGSTSSHVKYAYSSGNLKSSRLRKVLIIPNGSVGTPSAAGGQLTLSFFSPLKTFGFDVVDVDPGDPSNTFVTFRMAGSDLATIPFSEFKNMNSPYKKPGVVWGNNSANRIAPLTSAQIGGDFDEVVFDFPSEMAFDNFNYRVQTNVIPEPTAAGLILGLPALAALRRRRRQ